MAEREERYFLRKWEEVTKEDWVAAERAEGFRNTMGQPKEPATSSFSGKVYEGKRSYMFDNPGHSSVIDQGHNV